MKLKVPKNTRWNRFWFNMDSLRSSYEYSELADKFLHTKIDAAVESNDYSAFNQLLDSRFSLGCKLSNNPGIWYRRGVIAILPDSSEDSIDRTVATVSAWAKHRAELCIEIYQKRGDELKLKKALENLC